MNFIEAVQAMKEGKICELNYNKYCIKNKYLLMIRKDGWKIPSNLSAMDAYNSKWEVLEDEEDWNLAEQCESNNISNRAVLESHVKKCRDLIIEDLEEYVELGCIMKSAGIYLKNTINKRFGDLK